MLFVAIFFVFLSSGLAAVQGTLGTAVVVTGNTATTINFAAVAGGTQTTLVITLDQTASVTLSVVASVSFGANLAQYQQAALVSGAVGYNLAVSGGANILSAVFTSDDISAAIVTQLTAAGNVPGLLYFNVTAQSYTEVAATVVGTVTKQLTASLAAQGSYCMVFRASTAPIARAFSQAVAVAAATQTKAQYQSTTTSQLVITQTTQAQSTFTATEYVALPAGITVDMPNRVSSFFDLSSTVSSGIQAQLNLTYDSARVASKSLNAANLAWYYYNTATSSWQFDGAAQVDVNSKTVVRSTTHFSTWAVSSAGSLQAALAAVLGLAFLSSLL
jgi:hypothetical protein